MTDVISEKRTRDVRGGQTMVDVDVHEMLASIKNLVPYLETCLRTKGSHDFALLG